MKYVKIIFSLLIVSAICDTGFSAGKSRPLDVSDVYPRGYYSTDPLPDKTAYLTFDDGPSDWTDGILDILMEEKVKATFFISAYWNIRSMKERNSFQIHKDSLLRTVREGHVLANHTASHRALSRLTTAQIRKQFISNQHYLEKTLGKQAPFMSILRPPLGDPWACKNKGDAKKYVGDAIKDIGILAMWTKDCDSTDSWDWARGEWFRNCPRINDRTASFQKKKDRVYNRVITRADGKGMVILLHDTHLVTREVLHPLIKELKRRGYVFRTMEDLVVWKYGKGSRELLGMK